MGALTEATIINYLIGVLASVTSAYFVYGVSRGENTTTSLSKSKADCPEGCACDCPTDTNKEEGAEMTIEGVRLSKTNILMTENMGLLLLLVQILSVVIFLLVLYFMSGYAYPQA